MIKLHTVTILNKKTGETVYRKSHVELVTAVVDFNSQKRMRDKEEYEVELKSKR